MVAAKKKIKDYLAQSMRKLKHRKGYGVHSPFAYSIITEVIEEKLPYYAYRRMLRSYDKQAPITHKVACLLLRLANRFHCRQVVELSCDGGYTILPLILTDTRLTVASMATDDVARRTQDRLAWVGRRLQQISFVPRAEQLQGSYDMIVVNDNPWMTVPNPSPEAAERATQELVTWVLEHAHDDTVIWVHGIQPRQRLEQFWDTLCDRDEVTITMDLFNYGLAILKPRFFKQHYIVAF